MSLFGPTRHPGQLEGAVAKGLRFWLPTYVKRMNEVSDRKLAPIKSFSIVSDYAKFPELALPAVVIESSGIVEGSIEAEEDGSLTADFTVAAYLMVQGKDAVRVRDTAMLYWWPIAAALLQHRTLDDGISVKRFVDSGFAGANVEQRRTRIATEHVFEVTLERFLNIGEGPLEPDPGADAEWPEVTSVETEVQKED